MSNNTNEEKVTKITKKQTKIIAIVVAVAVIIAGAVLISANQTAIYSRLLLSIMPESVVSENEPHIEYFVELADEINNEEVKENPLLAFSFYYYNENGDKVDLGVDPDLVENGQQVSLPVVFLVKSALDGNIPNIKNIITIAVVVAIIIIGAVLSIIWFVIWSKNEDKNKAQLKAKQNKKPKKKNQ